jgi:voltage-gated potassium channel
MGERKSLFILVVLLAIFFISPFLHASPIAGVVLKALLSVLLISAVYACAQKRHVLIIAAGIAVPALCAHWISYFSARPEPAVIGHVLTALFLVYIICIILKEMVHAKRVTAAVIYGAISTYFLIGMFWASVYSTMELVEPESFAGRPLEVDESDAVECNATPLPGFMYYSLVALTTLGYGDITPVTPPAQVASALEAVVGQLYLAILIAGLVGLHVSQRRE